jgi:glutathione peroxidase
MSHPLYDIPVRRIDGAASSLGDFRGEVLLVVNVASACGLTPQYGALQQAYETYRDRGFSVLAFPANEFGGQEPGSNEEIRSFCTGKYDVGFPLFEKIVVKGDGQHPLYAELTASAPPLTEKPDSPLRARLAQHGLAGPGPTRDVLWNFEKFLIGRDGAIAARFAPDIPPLDPLVTAAVEAELDKQG